MEKLFVNRKPYISPLCEIIEMNTESNILESSLQQTGIDVIEDGTISQPQQIFSRPKYPSCFDQEEE